MKSTKLALALAALAALAAFAGASAASAAQYKSSSSPVNLSGSQAGNQVFNIQGQNVSCTSATFTRNELATPANEVSKVVPTYGNCTTFGFAGSVNMASCAYNFDTPNAGLTANLDLVCTNNATGSGTPVSGAGGVVIIMMVPGGECEVHMVSQNEKGTLTFVNENPVAGDVLVQASVSGLTAQITADNGFCPLTGPGTVNNATYSGEFSLTGPLGVNFEVG